MLLTKDQVNLFWKLWAKACKAQSWDRHHGLNSAAVDAKRKEFLAKCGFTSLTKVDPRDGFSLVKRELLKLDDQVQGPLEEVKPTIETGRTGRWFLEHDLFPCLAVYAAVDQLLAGLTQDWRFCWKMGLGRGERFTLDELTDDPVIKTVKGQPREFPSQLFQLMTSLSAILNGKEGLRAKAGDSIHDMRLKASLDCTCKKCREMAAFHEADRRADDALAEHAPVPEAGPHYDPENCPF